MNDLSLDIVLAKLGGATNEAIGLLHDLRPGTVAGHLARAVRRGQVDAAAIGRGKAGSPLPEEAYRAQVRERIRAMSVIDANGCWIWQGCKKAKGYGQTSWREKGAAAHRVSYRAFIDGNLESWAFVCHHCDVPGCVNPAHLFVGDNSSNQKDASRKGRHQETKKTHCPKGHPYDESNTYYVKTGRGGTSRQCRECSRAKNRRNYLRRMEAARANQ